jgi:cytochrome P450
MPTFETVTKEILGPGRWETLRRLLPNALQRFTPFLSDMTARYGNIFAYRALRRSAVFVNEPALIKDVFVTQQHAFSKSAEGRALRCLVGEGLVTSEEPLHRQMRRIVQPAFHRERIAGYMRVMESDAVDFVERVRADEPFDVHAAMSELTLRIASMTLFGSDQSGSKQAVSEALRLIMEEVPRILTPLGRLLRRLPLPSTRRFDRARKTLDDIIYGLIARRRREGTDAGDALSMLLAAADSETGHRPSDEQIRDEVMTLFLAGHETTANLLTWTFYLLSANPEIDARVGTAAAGDDREYIMRVVHESLRLYPTAGFIGRESLHEVTLVDGSLVPAKATVFVCPLLLHRRPELFPDPLRFDPDRWLGPEPPPFAYFPFGGGARRCIGEDFAWNEAAIILGTIARRYRLALEAGR